MSDLLDGPSSYSSMGERLYTLKFVLVGTSGVGKTQLASRIVRGEYRDNSLPTVGMEFATRPLRYAENASVRAQVWDTAGKFPFKSMTEAYFRGAVGAMLVYDISRRNTFDDLTRWLVLVREYCHPSIALLLVGNKSDLSSKKREVSMMEGMRFARKNGLDFLETSALMDENVEEATRQLIMSVARFLPREKSIWSVKKPAYPLPAGWVKVAASSEGEEDDHNTHACFNDISTNVVMPPPPPKSVKGGGKNDHTARVTSRDVWYEDTWTGVRVSQRPLYPAGPSDACLVSQVPRALDASTYLADPVKAEISGTMDEGDGWGSMLKMVGRTPSWSFSSFKAKGCAAASDCLSKCMDS